MRTLLYCLLVLIGIEAVLAIYRTIRVKNIISAGRSCKDNFKIHEHGYWEDAAGIGHRRDLALAKVLVDFFKGASVIDLGCGTGYYTKLLNDNGIPCIGYDGNPYTKANGWGEVADFSRPQYLGEYDYVLSLEVGEHIPKEFEVIYFQNLARHSKLGIVLSWAIEGQAGDGHVNCRNNDYVIGKLKFIGYKFDKQSSDKLRLLATLRHFKNTLMVFQKIK
jgi:SAM-dependent methyltransferase